MAKGSSGVPAPVLGFNQQNNQATAGALGLFAGHRGRVTGLLIDAVRGATADVETANSASDNPTGPRAPRFALLGAGNGNDVDVSALVSGIASSTDPTATSNPGLHLVDLDTAAVAATQARWQQVLSNADLAADIHVHAPVDVTGGMGRLTGWKRRGPTAGQLEALAGSRVDDVVGALTSLLPTARPTSPSASVAAPAASLRAGFDVTASTCLLSQILQGAALTLGVVTRRCTPSRPRWWWGICACC